MDIKIIDGIIQLENNDLALVTGQEAIKQDITAALHTIKGEYFLNKNIGINYFDEILPKGANPAIIDGIFKAAILGRPGVLNILSFNTDVDGETRVMTITGNIQTIAGEIDITEVL